MCRSFAVHLVSLLAALLAKPAVGQPGVIASASGDMKELARLIFNPAMSGVEITKAESVGNSAQFGMYAQVGDFFQGLPGFGTVLSSGKVEEVKGGGNPKWDLGGLGDADLDAVLKTVGPPNVGYVSKDAAALLIQVKVSRPVTITVAYVFGSMDFEFATSNTPLPDLFGLFLNSKNVALIGGKPVSTATIYCKNDQLNCKQLIIPPNTVGTSLFGYTTTQQATLDLPIGTHQIKLAVADGLIPNISRSTDAAVFICFVGAVKAPTAAPVSPPVVSPPVAIPGKMKMAMMMMS
jgi:hypothetical protein